MTAVRRGLTALLLLLAGFCSAPGVAHESQPGLLELRQLTPERWEPNLTWLGVASFLVLGLLVAADVKLPPIAVASLATAYGALHGLLNGMALASIGAGPATLLGIALTVWVLVLLTTAVIVPLRALWARVAVRVAGSWVAAVGMLMLAWLAQGAGS